MIIKIIYKIKIHIFFYLIFIISILTGQFKEYIIITSIILFHECGHILTSIYYKWNIDKVVILPFGAITIFKEKINSSLKEEFLILIMGPLFQIMYYILFSKHLSDSINYLNKIILLFNLLPIYPLDGSKLLNIFLNLIFPFKLSHKLTIYISFITIFILVIFSLNKFNLVFTLILIYIFIKVLIEFYNHDNVFNKFLFERYNYDLNFNKTKIIHKLKIGSMYKSYKHLFYVDNTYKTEREVLKKIFDF